MTTACMCEVCEIEFTISLSEEKIERCPSCGGDANYDMIKVPLDDEEEGASER